MSQRFQSTIPKWLTPVLLGVIALTHALYVYFSGVKMCPDCYWYAEQADKLIDNKFNIFRVSAEIYENMYLAWIAALSLIKVLFGPFWQYGVLAFNFILDLFLAFLVIRIVQHASSHLFVLLITAGLFLISFENILWVSFVLADTSFTALTFGVLCLSVSLSSPGSGLRTPWLLAATACLTMLALIYRPTAIPLIPLIALVFVTSLFIDAEDVKKRGSRARLITLIVAIAGVVSVIVHTYVIQKMLGSDFVEPSVRIISKLYGEGVVIHGRLETYHNPPESLLDIAAITLNKFFHYFVFSIDAFSLKHKVANYFFFLPVYALTVVTLFELYRKESCLSPQAWRTAFLSAAFILFFALYHSMTILDYDWRYRLPCIPPFIVLAGIGSERVYSYLKASS
ncbi:MAG: hypothetical protein HY731_13650 [Candidatus Tectomicrobia bacterium]|nr:hypothetical protein [Candidatus Tectomicrobia bacterium]